jgi:hypothetical protein|tara:strand:- start:2045 stop:2251 length:207 start_codon:yes stop_codon:yes gene_type:complete
MSSTERDQLGGGKTILKAPQNQEEVIQKYEEGAFLIKKFYMFMYEDEDNLYFKHKITRDYVAIRKEKP